MKRPKVKHVAAPVALARGGVHRKADVGGHVPGLDEGAHAAFEHADDALGEVALVALVEGLGGGGLIGHDRALRLGRRALSKRWEWKT